MDETGNDIIGGGYDTSSGDSGPTSDSNAPGGSNYSAPADSSGSGSSTGGYDYLGALLKGAGSAYQTYSGAANANAKARQKAATTNSLKQYLPWAIGGVVLLLVLSLVLGRK